MFDRTKKYLRHPSTDIKRARDDGNLVFLFKEIVTVILTDFFYGKINFMNPFLKEWFREQESEKCARN